MFLEHQEEKVGDDRQGHAEYYADEDPEEASGSGTSAPAEYDDPRLPGALPDCHLPWGF